MRLISRNLLFVWVARHAHRAVLPLQEDDQLEAEPHIDDFRMLRKRIFEWSGAGSLVARRWKHTAALRGYTAQPAPPCTALRSSPPLDWSQVQPLDYLAPFLRLVREPDVSGPITGVALTALWRMLSNGALGEST